MKKEVNFAIGFITGRPNVCKIINTYSKYLVEQVQELNFKVNFTIFVLFDLGYQFTTRTDFYGILPEVYKNVTIKYITPEAIDEDKKKIMSKFDLTQAEADLLIGKGYAKARNMILYTALRKKMDYLLFWDDDEYPLANIKEEGDAEINWQKQPTIKQHILNIKNVDITCGDRCGIMNPVPYIEYNETLQEEEYKAFINGISNEVITWDYVSKTRKKNGFLKYASSDIAFGKKKPEIVSKEGEAPVMYGSNLCLNLNHIDKIPAFYNPPGARGEDTFFSCALAEKDARVLRVPTYHFHDSFLKFTTLMKEKYPKTLQRVSLDDTGIEQRFLKTTIGWTKYKPLLYYITEHDKYRKIINDTRKNLEYSIPSINTCFETCDFSCLLKELDEYDKNVRKHYNEYKKTIEIWDRLKFQIRDNKK